METKDKKYYVVKDAVPVRPVHPGVTLKEELEARGIRQKVFAEQVGMQATHLSAIIHGKRDVTPAVAAKLEKGLPGISAEFWLRFQEEYNLDVKRCAIRDSFLVTGYKPEYSEIGAAVAEPAAEYNRIVHAFVTIPAADREFLEIVAKRMGWSVSF